jgi:malonyl-ACP decarboxylase
MMHRPVLGIVAAGNNLSQNYHYGLLCKFQSTPQYLTPKYAIHYMDTDHVGTLSEIFKIQGEGFTVGGASASGNAAIIKGCQLIQLGILDACVIVGAMADLSPLELQGFYNVGALGGKRFRDQPDKACRPFDKDHEGFIYGQAGGSLILESPDSAQKRNVPPLAEIGGGALVLDGNRLPNPNADGEARAMESALKQAGIKPGEVNYLNAHGTSSPLGDETEIKAVKQVFKESISHLWINSTKGLTGHCLTAAGVIEGIATIIQMKEGFIHPNLNLEHPIDDECKFSRHQSIETSIHTAVNNSFGFGGINTSVIFKKGET